MDFPARQVSKLVTSNASFCREGNSLVLIIHPIAILRNMKRPSFQAVAAFFWLFYFVLPVGTGLLAYQWLPNENYDYRNHELLNSHSESVGPEGLTSAEVPDRWRNDESGEVFTPAMFYKHRAHEAQRLLVVWFGYGLIGCLFYAYSKARAGRGLFMAALISALIVNSALAAFVYLMT